MKVSINKIIRYFEVDAEYRLKLGVLFQLLQETVIRHTEAVGMSTQEILEQRGTAWVLHQITIEIHRYPKYREEITAITWARGLEGVKALREFEVFAGTEKVASASTTWLYIDVDKKRVRKIPEDMPEIYTIEPEAALEEPVEKWKGDPDFVADFEMEITIRVSDYDVNGHVNNSMYIDYLTTALFEFYGKSKKINMLKIRYLQEIDMAIRSTKVGIKTANGKILYKIFNADVVYAFGETCIDKV